MNKVWNPLVAGTALLSGATAMLSTSATAKADSITTTAGFNAPVLAGSQQVIASYYVSPVSSLATSSAAMDGGHSDPTVGLETYIEDYPLYSSGDPHGTLYSAGQSFTTGSSQVQLNAIGFALGDADDAAAFSSAAETLKIYKLNTDGSLTSVYSSTTTGTPYNIRSAIHNTQFNLSPGTAPVLDANTTYVFTLDEAASGGDGALLIRRSGSSSDPGGTTGQQLVSVNNSDLSFLTYSGYSERTNINANETRATAILTQTDDQYSDGTTRIYSPTGSPNISGTSKIGIFNGANPLGIDQIDFYVIGTTVPEPGSIGLLGAAGLGLLARRRQRLTGGNSDAAGG